MQDRNWESYFEPRGKDGVEEDLKKQFTGVGPSFSFTLWWFEDKDIGNNNFRERIKKLLGEKKFVEITESLNQ